MSTRDQAQHLVTKIDEGYLIDTLVELAQVPTDVPLGPQTFMEPDDPKLVRYVQESLRPKLDDLGAKHISDVPVNQLLVHYGDGKSQASLLVMVYTPTQHHNLMEDPFSGKIANAAEWGYDEPCVFGHGVTQNKAHHAVKLAVLKLLVEEKINLPGNLYFAVNNEGRSSHWCSDQILNALDRKPDFCLLLTGTGMRISLGNRGRLDVDVEIKGKAVHSSAPSQGLSAIEGAHEFLNRLKKLQLPGTHPILGERHAIAYQIVFEPLAPHTLPEVARIKVDRRLLPGDDLDQAVEEVREAIGDLTPYQVTVTKGPHMLPALVNPQHPGVQALTRAHQMVYSQNPETYYGQGTFDAGGPCAAGVPTVMYGVGGGASVLGEDFAPVRQVVDEARVLVHTIMSLLG
jgi:acetylornithine deacetylase/succinyl-diaminopimelate desuccinylase-like protein